MVHGAEFAELEAFVAVAERLSFVRAASATGIAAATLWETIRRLEERLGVRLMIRTTRSLALTEAGRLLLDRLRPALAAMTAVLQRFRDSCGTPVLSVRQQPHRP